MERTPLGPRGPQPGPIAQAVLPIVEAHDVVIAREGGRAFAAALGFSGSDLTVLATAISGLARQFLDNAETGEIVVFHEVASGRARLVIEARDAAPVARPLLDELEIASRARGGTTVTVRKSRS